MFYESSAVIETTEKVLKPDFVELEGHKIGNIYSQTRLDGMWSLVYITKHGTFHLVNAWGKAITLNLTELNTKTLMDERRLDWLTWRYGEDKQYYHGPLSNFYIEKDGKSLEHRFASMKTTDLEWKKRIMEASAPGYAKKLGKQCPLRGDWDEIKRDVMWDLLLKKFVANPFARKYLLATDDIVITERNTWNDRIWGQDLSGKGQNLLGMGLMYVREVLNG